MSFSAENEPVLLCRQLGVKDLDRRFCRKTTARIAESSLVPEVERLGCHLLLEAENNMIQVFITLLLRIKL